MITAANEPSRSPIRTRRRLAPIAVNTAKWSGIADTPGCGIWNWAWSRISATNLWGGGRMIVLISPSAAVASQMPMTIPTDKSHHTASPAT